jgi:hypothetical protein
MSAFFLYSQGYRTQTKEENPEASFGEIVSLEKSTIVFACVQVGCIVMVADTSFLNDS